MCISCYIEYGSPNVLHERTSELTDLLQECDPYGALHIVVSDWNIEGDHIQWCIDNGAKEISEKERLAAELMLTMNLDQRATAMAIWEEYIAPAVGHGHTD